MTLDPTTSFFEALRPRLFGVAHRMLGVVAEAEEVVQDAFLQWHRADDRLRSNEAWLVSAMTRLAIDRLRRAATERAVYEKPQLRHAAPTATEAGPPVTGAAVVRLNSVIHSLRSPSGGMRAPAARGDEESRRFHSA